MWSKTRKALYERTAQCLKHRVNYEFYMKQKSYIDRALFISIDKKRRFATTPGCWDWSMSFEREIYLMYMLIGKLANWQHCWP